MRFEVTDDWAVGLDDDTLLVAVINDDSLLAPRMKLRQLDTVS